LLDTRFTADTPLPQPGSFGYCRGTAQKCRVIRRNARRPGEDGPTCLVQLFDRFAGRWEPVTGSAGNREVPEREIYPTENEAVFCGKPPTAAQRRALFAALRRESGAITPPDRVRGAARQVLLQGLYERGWAAEPTRDDQLPVITAAGRQAMEYLS
jgi:hypothetical protein